MSSVYGRKLAGPFKIFTRPNLSPANKVFDFISDPHICYGKAHLSYLFTLWSLQSPPESVSRSRTFNSDQVSPMKRVYIPGKDDCHLVNLKDIHLIYGPAMTHT